MKAFKIDLTRLEDGEPRLKKRKSIHNLAIHTKSNHTLNSARLLSRSRANSMKSQIVCSSSQKQLASSFDILSRYKNPGQAFEDPSQNPILTLLQKYQDTLSAFQQNQLLTYKQVFYFDHNIRRVLQGDSNFGYDKNGVYQLILGDHIAYRYQIKDLIGQGSFSQVIQAYDHRDKEAVALKICKNSFNFQEKIQNQIDVLEKLSSEGNNMHIPDIKNHFDFRNHKIIVFPLYGESLRKFLKQNAPVSVELTQLLASQILRALHAIHQSGFIHCDLKPENIVFSNPENIVVIDYGSACQILSIMCDYIQSRYYRAPEVVLGLPYSTSLDIWSFGCILAEFFLGTPLFLAENSHELIVKIAAIRGKPPLQFINLGQRSSQFFDQNKKIIPLEEPVQKRTIQQVLAGADPYLVDLVDRCLQYNPQNRPTAREAFKHPFFGNNQRKKNIKQKTYHPRAMKKPPKIILSSPKNVISSFKFKY